ATYQFTLTGNRTLVANFTSASPPIDIGAAETYGGFGGSAGMTNQGIFTLINGDIGTTAASTLITGFHDTDGNVYTETPLNIGTVNGTIYCAPPAPGTAEKFAIAQQALADATTAFNYLAGLPSGPDPGAGELGGLVLAPGTYTAAAGTFKITSGDLTLDAQNNPNAEWVFQIATSLTVGKAGQPRSIILVNGAQAKNIFWQVGSSATINGAGGGTMAGTIISYSGVTFSTAGNVTLTTLNGRALSLNASVTLVNTIINVP
ncbi:MAG: ice-binding family protein, partial [bacterium]|nr:ice-binding family protein [bacterium]